MSSRQSVRLKGMLFHFFIIHANTCLISPLPLLSLRQMLIQTPVSIHHFVQSPHASILFYDMSASLTDLSTCVCLRCEGRQSPLFWSEVL